MRISVIAVALAAAIWSHEASGQNVVQKTNWQAKAFKIDLSQPIRSIPRLDLNIRTKSPKHDWPVGLRADAAAPFGLGCAPTDAQASSTVPAFLNRV